MDADDGGGLTRKTAIGAAWLLSWRLISRSLGIVSTLILARVLMPADFGVVAMATTFGAAIEALSQLGLQDALVRRAGDDRALFDTAFTLQAGRAMLIAATVAAASPVAAWWFDEPRLGPVLLVLAAGTFVAGFENVGIVEFRRAMRFDVQVRLLFVPRLLQVATTIPLALSLHSYWALLAGIVVSQVARTTMTYWVHPYRPRFALSGWRELAGFSFWTWASSAAAVVWDRADPFILGPVVGTARLGLYLISVELAILPVTEIVSPISDALFAGFARAQTKGQASAHHAPMVAAALVMVIMPITITISCGSAYVVAALLGPQWAEAVPLVAILAWLCPFTPISFVCNTALIANGRVRRSFTGRLIASLVKLVVMVVAVSVTQRLDQIAVAVAVCVALESCAYVLLLRGVGEVRFAPMWAAIGRALLAGGAVLLLLSWSGLAWQPTSAGGFHALLAGAVLGGFVTLLYAASLALLWRLSGKPPAPEAMLAQLGLATWRNLVARMTSMLHRSAREKRPLRL